MKGALSTKQTRKHREILKLSKCDNKSNNTRCLASVKEGADNKHLPFLQ